MQNFNIIQEEEKYNAHASKVNNLYPTKETKQTF